MRVAELYQSRQGEGQLTGAESVFVRASGCNLRCWFCDTPFASWHPEGDDLSVDEVLERVFALGAHHVVLTGGEPMLFAELIPLTEQLHRAGRHITIETAGTLDLPVVCDLMSISPKLDGSGPRTNSTGQSVDRWTARHEQSRQRPNVIRALIARYEYQFKFVIDEPRDLQAVEDYLTELPEIDRSKVWLMPQGTSRPELAAKEPWVGNYSQQHGLQFSPRRQIEWFGYTRGT
jgi:7-carboxy-7-deazaguanine synthase